jgi:hypothetical protein
MNTQTACGASPLQLLQMTNGLVVHQTISAAAKLGIADLLGEGARSAGALAADLQVNEDALYRTLRFLAAQGVFRETSPRTFANSPLSEYLRTDVPGSVRSLAIFRGSGYYVWPFAEFLFSVETGLPARSKVAGTGGFEYLRSHPDEARAFDEAMTDVTRLWAPAVAGAYDFGQWDTVTDVGGGNGLLLATILSANRDLQGVLADEPAVLERARQRGFLSGELEHRVRLHPCNFFDAVPSGSRAYLMKNVIHDWDDEQARRILRNCRQAVPQNGALLLVEYHVGDENVPSVGKLMDIVMLTVTGGKERTVSEHRELLASAGFRLNRSIPVSQEIVLLEAF